MHETLKMDKREIADEIGALYTSVKTIIDNYQNSGRINKLLTP